MRLLELSDGQVSLELSGAEVAVAVDGLRRFGPVVRVERATHDLLNVGGSELVFMQEWDEPCLISRDEAGVAMLRALAGDDRARRTKHAVAGRR